MGGTGSRSRLPCAGVAWDCRPFTLDGTFSGRNPAQKVSTLIAFLYRYSLICLVTPGTLIVARTLGAEKKSTLVGMMRDFGGKSRTVEGSCR